MFVWKGKELKTVGQIMEAAARLKSLKEGQAFMKLARESSPHADANIGYCTGYLDGKAAARVLRFTKTSHPVFGTKS